MLNSKATQFQLSAEGEILWQEKQNNPMPGVAVARLVKGDHILAPGIEILSAPSGQEVEPEALKAHLSLWLQGHMSAVLEPLMLLGIEGAVGDETVQAIVRKMYDGMGTLSREALHDDIAKLDAEKRTALRAKKIRLGPVLVFMPALNKPAAVRLRGLLWCLYHDKSLPAPVPADGIVSVAIADERADPAFYRAIGYPLYGGRAVRIDMLDRVINAVYESAVEGKFQAKHEMAEWLGCPITDLYAILEAMGHKKIHDPADDIVVATGEKDVPVVEVPAVENADALESEQETEGAVKPPEPVKPALATFVLRRGRPGKSFNGGGQGKSSVSKKPFKKKDQKSSEKKRQKDKKREKPKQDRGPRVITIEAKKNEEDSPFAILQQLKTKN